MRQAFADTMLAIGRQDPKLVVLVGDIGHTILKPFAAVCPGRYFNIGILEAATVNIAAGMAKTGLYPVVHTIAPFLVERAFEQIKLDFCYQELGGTLVSVGAAFDYAGLGCSHHCYDDLGLIKSLPGSQVVYPASPWEFETLFRQTYQNGKLTYFRLSEQHGVDIPKAAIRLGRGVIIRLGSGKTIICTGPQLKTVMDALPLIPENTTILYYPTIKPFDAALACCSISIKSPENRRVLVVEEHSMYGGLADDVRRTGSKVDAICIPDEFQRGYGTRQDHLNALGFTPQNIEKRLAAL